MISWIVSLCVLCSLSALAQMVVQDEGERDALRMICGLLMLHMTMEKAEKLLAQLTDSASLSEILALVMK